MQDTKNHSYGGRVPSLSEYLEDFYRPENTQGLLEGLTNFMRDKYGESYSWTQRGQQNSEYEGVPKTKAEQILGLESNSHISKLESLPPKKAYQMSEEDKKKLISQAIENGYLDEVHLRTPWHPKPFLEGKIETFPYEHESAILYTNVTVNELFVGGGPKHIRSALADNYFKPENDWADLPEPDEMDFDKWSGNELGIYMGFLNIGETFGSYISRKYNTEVLLLEVEIPTDKLNTLVRKKEDRKKGNIKYSKEDMIDLQSLQGMEKEFNEQGFENPIEAFHHYCQKVASAKNLGKAEGIQFGVRHAIPFGWVRGAWDKQEHYEPLFEPLDKVIERLENRHPIKMPGVTSKEERKELIKEQIEQEYTHLVQMDQDAKDILEIIKEVDNELAQLSEPVSGSKSLSEKEAEALVDFLISKLSEPLGYNSHYKRMRRKMKYMINFSLEESPKIEFLDQLMEEIDEIRNRAEKILQITDEDFEEEIEKAAQNHWNLKDLEKKRDFREKIEEDLVKLIENLPNLLRLTNKLSNHRQQYVNRLS